MIETFRIIYWCVLGGMLGLTLSTATSIYRTWKASHIFAHTILASFLILFWVTRYTSYILFWHRFTGITSHKIQSIITSPEKLQAVETICVALFPHAQSCHERGDQIGECAPDHIRDSLRKLHPIPPTAIDRALEYDFVRIANDHRIEHLRIDSRVAPFASYEIDTPQAQHIENGLHRPTSSSYPSFWQFMQNTFNPWHSYEHVYTREKSHQPPCGLIIHQQYYDWSDGDVGLRIALLPLSLLAMLTAGVYSPLEFYYAVFSITPSALWFLLALYFNKKYRHSA
jgi:hypothetical protein